MTKIIIDDGLCMPHDTIQIIKEVDWIECGMYDLICTENIRYIIANKLANKNNISMNNIDKEIDKYYEDKINRLKSITKDEVIMTLEDNGIRIN